MGVWEPVLSLPKECPQMFSSLSFSKREGPQSVGVLIGAPNVEESQGKLG